MATGFSDSGTRTAMERYWKTRAREASGVRQYEDEGEEVLSQEEVSELLGLLPDYSGKDVVELGAGAGRFTGKLAEKAKSVYATDFIPVYVDKCTEANGQHTNVSIELSDATKTERPEESVDLVFSSWLFMYMSDAEIRNLLERQLSWLREGGHVFFCESCLHKGKSGAGDPTIYRSPADYHALYQSISIPDKAGQGSYYFELALCRPVQTYFMQPKWKSTPLCWLLVKVHRPVDAQGQGVQTFQEFLDAQQYSRTAILRYESVFGRHFVSPGGKDSTEKFVGLLKLKARETVLDVGCGIGGAAFYMAQKFKVSVLGIDVSTNMNGIAWERLSDLRAHGVQFEVADATKRTFEEGSFDAIYCQDTIQHITDKQCLLHKFYTWLKPGGRLLVTSYCRSKRGLSDEFEAYVQNRGYNLLPIQENSKMIEAAGFVNMKTDDVTYTLIGSLQRELCDTKVHRDDFVKKFTQEDFDEMVHSWDNKLGYCRQGDFKWGQFYAEKPTA